VFILTKKHPSFFFNNIAAHFIVRCYKTSIRFISLTRTVMLCHSCLFHINRFLNLSRAGVCVCTCDILFNSALFSAAEYTSSSADIILKHVSAASLQIEYHRKAGIHLSRCRRGWKAPSAFNSFAE